MGPQLDPFPVRGAAWCVPRGRDLSAFGRLPCPHEVAGSKQVEPRAVPPPLTQGWAWGGPRKPEQGPQARDTAGEALRQRAPDSKMRVRLRGEGARRQEGDSAPIRRAGPRAASRPLTPSAQQRAGPGTEGWPRFDLRPPLAPRARWEGAFQKLSQGDFLPLKSQESLPGAVLVRGGCWGRQPGAVVSLSHGMPEPEQQDIKEEGGTRDE